MDHRPLPFSIPFLSDDQGCSAQSGLSMLRKFLKCLSTSALPGCRSIPLVMRSVLAWLSACSSPLLRHDRGSRPTVVLATKINGRVQSYLLLLCRRTLDGDTCRPHESGCPAPLLQVALVPQWYWFWPHVGPKASCSWQCCSRCSVVMMSALHGYISDSPTLY